MGYTKLFTEIVASSIWDEDDKTRLVWITMLALKDRNHFVRGTVNYLALASRVTVTECEAALAKLLNPDPKSRSTEHEGRRVREEPGGWTVLNGEKYRNLLSVTERNEYNRVKQAEYRLRKKQLTKKAKQAGGTQAVVEIVKSDAVQGAE